MTRDWRMRLIGWCSFASGFIAAKAFDFHNYWLFALFVPLGLIHAWLIEGL